MKRLIQAIDFIEDFMRWSKKRKDIQAAALIGSYAREEASKDSDVDLVIITKNPKQYFTNDEWIRIFGVVITKKVEEYGKLTSLRVWYENGLEIEYGFATPEWIQAPLDEGTRQIIDDGLRVLFEKDVLLSPHETPPVKKK